MATFNQQILSPLLPKGQVHPGAVLMGFLHVCREPWGVPCVPACKGDRKSVFLNQVTSEITPNPRASQGWSHPDTLHPKALGEALHTHLRCIDLHQEQLSLECARAELFLSDNSLTSFVATHQLSSVSLYGFFGPSHSQVMPRPVQSLWLSQENHRMV